MYTSYLKNKQNSRDIKATRISLQSHKDPITIDGQALDVHHLSSHLSIPRGLPAEFSIGSTNIQTLLFNPSQRGGSFTFREGEIFVQSGNNLNRVVHAGNLEIVKETEQSTGTIRVKSGTSLTSGSDLKIKSSPFPICVCNNDGNIDSKQIFDQEVSEWVMGNVKEGHSGKAYKQGLVREGSDNHQHNFLRKDGQWAIPHLTFSGTVAENFLSLNDTPSTYDGAIGKLLQTSNLNGGSVQFVDPTTDLISEGSNLYFTENRVDQRINQKLSDGSFSNISISGKLTCSEVICTSDQRLKTDIEDISNEKVCKLNKLEPKQFKFRDSKKTRFGFMAQNIKEIYPDLVNENNDGFLGVNYIDLIALVMASHRKMDEKITRLEKQIKNMSKSAA